MIRTEDPFVTHIQPHIMYGMCYPCATRLRIRRTPAVLSMDEPRPLPSPISGPLPHSPLAYMLLKVDMTSAGLLVHAGCKPIQRKGTIITMKLTMAIELCLKQFPFPRFHLVIVVCVVRIAPYTISQQWNQAIKI